MLSAFQDVLKQLKTRNRVIIQMLDSSPPAAARVFLCCEHGSRRLPCSQHKTPLQTTEGGEES